MKNADIILAASRAVASSEAVRSAAVETYGRGLLVVCGAYPTEIPDIKDAPFLMLMPEGGDRTARYKADRSLKMRGVLGVCPTGENGEKIVREEETRRTSAANGLVIYGAAVVMDALRDAVIDALRHAATGAIVEDITIEAGDFSHFPLEWTIFTVTYTEYAALSDN